MNYHDHVKNLKEGKTVQFRPKGSSMTPRIESGQLVTVSPVNPEEVEKGDIVLCKVKGRFFVHLVSAIQGERYQISNNKGHINGWVGVNGIFGKVTKIEK